MLMNIGGIGVVQDNIRRMMKSLGRVILLTLIEYIMSGYSGPLLQGNTNYRLPRMTPVGKNKEVGQDIRISIHCFPFSSSSGGGGTSLM